VVKDYIDRMYKNEEGITEDTIAEKVAADLNLTKEEVEKAITSLLDKKTYPGDITFGYTTLDSGEPSSIRSIAKSSANKVKLELIGDPYWLFSGPIIAGRTEVKIEVIRPGIVVSGSQRANIKDVFLSGRYYVLKIEHSIKSDGFTTILHLTKHAGIDSNFTIT
jgi:hypothetical protein